MERMIPRKLELYSLNLNPKPQGGVTPIDSIVTTATTVGQWSKPSKRMQSTIKACSEAYTVYGQSALRSAVKLQMWVGLHMRSKAENQCSQR